MNVGMTAILILLAQLASAQQSAAQSTAAARVPVNRFVGIWTLDVARSTFDAGQRLASQVRTYEPFGDGQRGTIESVDAAGTRIKYGYAARFDGRYYPMTGTGMPSGADAITIMRVDDNTMSATLRKAEREVMQARLTVSGDGKVLTIRRTGTTTAVLVFNRQQAP